MRRVFGGLASGWKLILTAGLLVAILGSVCLRAPRRPIARFELRQLVLSAMLLYGIGVVASVVHRGGLAGVLYASGIVVCSVAVWLSRGFDRGDGPDGPGGSEPPTDEDPSTGPDGIPPWDWDAFERERAAWSERNPASR
ncbi:MAG TPA: hypothetical protein VG405_00105 [Solirubrobacteraceae bacterium]|jgi:hypothetical protein|nr:hypothetical protein [Solirubrobacteraceae bacterium]